MKSMSFKDSHSTLNLSIERERIPRHLSVVTKSTGWVFGNLNHLNELPIDDFRRDPRSFGFDITR